MKLPIMSTSAAITSQVTRGRLQDFGCSTPAWVAQRKTAETTDGARNRAISVRTGRIIGLKSRTRTLARARGAARCASGRQTPRDPGPSARIATRNITTKATPRGGYAADFARAQRDRPGRANVSGRGHPRSETRASRASPPINPLVQVPQNPRGHPPNVALAERHGVVLPCHTLPVAAVERVVLRVHQEGKRDLEGVG